jgi:hypothetical protein
MWRSQVERGHGGELRRMRLTALPGKRRARMGGDGEEDGSEAGFDRLIGCAVYSSVTCALASNYWRPGAFFIGLGPDLDNQYE